MKEKKPKVKKDNTQLMKVLCYFTIVLCVAIIIIPPVFRKVFPRPVVTPTEKDKYTMLACNSEDNGETIVVTYYGDELTIGQLKYTVAADAESWIAKDLYQDLNRSDAVNRRLIEDRNSFDRMQFLLSPKDANSKVLSPDELQTLSADNKQAPVSQKAYYENLGFKCTLNEGEQKTN